MTIQDLHFDCIHFRGDMPCRPNKESGSICNSCSEYSPISKRILIIKLGALGDVIRTTPLIERYRKEYPQCHITWITNHPEILPKDALDCVRTFSFSDIFILMKQHFDIAVNLCKDQEAAILLSECKAQEKCGFIWSDGHLSIANQASEHKLLTGLFDAYSKANSKSYVEEIFEICGFQYEHEPYILNVNSALIHEWSRIKTMAEGKPIIGLNTGAGSRWPTRLWPEENWKELILLLKAAGYAPLLLGGQDEHERNASLKSQTDAIYEGVFPLESFIAICAQCDIIITAVSMTMHIALGLGKNMILFNNIFNRHEFDLFGKGEIIEPEHGCDCYYGAHCTREIPCMKDISVQTVMNAIQKQIAG